MLEDYYRQLQTLNRQRGLTGNQAYNRGMDTSLYAGYFDTEMKNKRANEALQLQKESQAFQQDYQNRALAQNTDYQNRALTQSGTQFQQSLAQKDSQFGQQMSTSKDTATTNLIGQAIGGIANLYTMNKYLDKLPNKGAATSEGQSWYDRLFKTEDVATAKAYDTAFDQSNIDYGSEFGANVSNEGAGLNWYQSGGSDIISNNDSVEFYNSLMNMNDGIDWGWL